MRVLLVSIIAAFLASTAVAAQPAEQEQRDPVILASVYDCAGIGLIARAAAVRAGQDLTELEFNNQLRRCLIERAQHDPDLAARIDAYVRAHTPVPEAAPPPPPPRVATGL